MIYKIINILFALLVLTATSTAQKAQMKSGVEKSGFIYGYKIKDGINKLFEDGYKRHLQWHKNKNDQLVWYAWSVITGNRSGVFIDGSFGSPLKAFDERVDITGDGADFELTTAPFVEPLFRKILMCKENLSTVLQLEEQNPSKLIKVVTYNLFPGRSSAFENIVSRIIKNIDQEKVKFTLYEFVDGSETTQYLLMIPKTWYADYNSNNSLEKIITENFSRDKSSALLKLLNECVKSSFSETWAYKKDLSYFPDK